MIDIWNTSFSVSVSFISSHQKISFLVTKTRFSELFFLGVIVL